MLRNLDLTDKTSFEQYEEDLLERDRKQVCRHTNCPQCHGTGRKRDGTECVHLISCTCSKCSPGRFI